MKNFAQDLPPRLRRAAWGGVALAAAPLLWALLARGRTPGPGAVFHAALDAWASGELAPALAASLRRMALGYGLSLGAGLATGLALAASRRLDALFTAPLFGLQTLPSICWLPVAVLWFGPGERAILFMVATGAYLAIATAARDGLKRVDPRTLRAGRCLGATGAGLWLRVALPAAFPALLTGAQLGWVFAWRSLMAGELLEAGSAGLGRALARARDANDLARLFAVMLVILALGWLVDRALFAPAGRAVAKRWGLAPG